MDIALFFQPVEIDLGEHSFANVVYAHTEANKFPDLEGIQIAIFGVNESRGAVGNKGTRLAADNIRHHFYKLKTSDFDYKVADLGNINPGETIEDTYFAVKNTVTELYKKNILPIVLGGSQDLTFANYAAYQQLEQVVNIVSVDNKFDLGKAEDALHSESYLSKIILDQPNFLFNYSNIGFQSHFVDNDAVDLISKLFFDAHRLGEVNQEIGKVEPIIRNADIMSFDVSAIRMSDAPGCEQATPNGFYGEQACQIARYAGMSDKLSSIGFYEYNPEFDNRGQTAHLIAQMVWYFIEGYYCRKNDNPTVSKKNYLKYRVVLEEDDKYELLFYKSKQSDRWWIQVPYPARKGMKFERHQMVPCDYSEYEKALEGEMPDIWWKTYQKLI